MDPLSITASIAGLISLADLIVVKGGDFVKQVKERKEVVARLLGEVACLLGVLKGVKIVLDQSEKVLSAAVTDCGPVINQCDATLKKIKEILLKHNIPQGQPAQERSSTQQVRELITKLTWPLHSKETTDLLKQIESYKITFTVALGSGNMTLMLQILTKQSTIHDVILQGNDDIQTFRQEWKIKELDNEKRKIYDWCPGVDQTEKHRSTVQLREVGTGEWFLQCDEIRQWLREQDSFLWVYGIAGAGKTVLASLSIEEAKTSQDARNAVCYFYCIYDQKGEQSFACILGSLIKQLALQSDSAFKCLSSIHAQSAGKDGKAAPSTDTLEKCFHKILTCFDTTTIVIDALDEAEMSDAGVLDFIALLPRLVALRVQKSHVKVLAVSRETDIIKREFHGQPSLTIVAASTDIEIYVRREIERRCQAKVLKSRLTFQDPELKDTIIENLIVQAAGMFQLVKCQIDNLCNCRGDAAKREAMKRIPPTLQGSYERILKEVLTDGNKADQILFKKALEWLVYAKQSLDPTQIIEAISLEVGIEGMPQDFGITEEQLLFWCSSLVRVDPMTRTLSLSHFSVKEYLTGPEISQSDVAIFRIDETESDLLLANTCLTYFVFKGAAEAILSFEKANGGDSSKPREPPGLVYENPKYSLYGYCSKYWHIHITQQPDSSSLQGRLILKFLSEKESWAKAITYYNPTNNKYAPMHWNSLHLVSFFGWVSIAKSLVEDYGIDVNETYYSKYGHGSPTNTPLSLAANRGHYDLVQTLASLHADLSWWDAPDFESHAIDAWNKDNVDLVRFFILQSQRHSKNCTFNRLLFQHVNSITPNDDEKIETLIELLFDLVGPVMGTGPLDSSTCEIKPMLMENLLQEVKTSDLDVELIRSLLSGNPEFPWLSQMPAKRKLQYFAFFAPDKKFGGWIIEIVAKTGSAPILESLVASSELTADHLNNALKLVCCGGYKDAAHLLLEKGADPTFGMSGAIEGGNLDILEEFLAKGVQIGGEDLDISEANGGGLNISYDILSAAVESNKMVIIESLLTSILKAPAEGKALAEMTTLRKTAILNLAVKHDDCKALNALLTAYFDPVGFDVHGQAPLHAAVKACNPEATRLLLQAGASAMNRATRYDSSALEESLVSDKIKAVAVVELLWKSLGEELQAQLRPQSIRTLLNRLESAPTRNLDPRIIVQPLEFLISNATSVDINSRDPKESPALMIVMSRPDWGRDDENGTGAQIQLIQMLLTYGASIFDKDRDGRSSLEYAIECRNDDFVEALFSHGNPQELHSICNRLLHLGCQNNHFLSIKLAIGTGADVKSKSRNGLEPLHLLILKSYNKRYFPADLYEKNTRQAFDFLISAGASIESECQTSISPTVVVTKRPIHLAIDEGSELILKMLINEGVNFQDDFDCGLNCKVDALRYGITTACSEELLRTLIRPNTDVDSYKETHFAPIHLAVLSNGYKNIAVLSQAGANLEARTMDGGNSTPFLLAVGRGCNNEVVKTLLDLKADVCSINSKGQNCLHLAFISKRWTALPLLLQHTTQKMLHERDVFGLKPMHYAENWDQAPLLMEHDEIKCLPGKESIGYLRGGVLYRDGRSALGSCVQRGGEESPGEYSLQYYLDYHNQILNCGDYIWCRTPLHEAALLSNKPKILLTLLRAGACPGLIDYRGMTPFGLAAERGNVTVLEILLGFTARRRGALCKGCLARAGIVSEDEIEWISNIEYRALYCKKKTPFLLAASALQLPAVKFLWDQGADAAAVDSDGHGLVHYASQEGYQPLRHLILSQLSNDTISTSKAGIILRQQIEKLGAWKEDSKETAVPLPVDSLDAQGLTRLARAVTSGDFRGVATFISEGADVNRLFQFENPISRFTPLHLVDARADIALKLLEGGALNNEPDHLGYIPSVAAAKRGHFEVAYLISTFQKKDEGQGKKDA